MATFFKAALRISLISGLLIWNAVGARVDFKSSSDERLDLPTSNGSTGNVVYESIWGESAQKFAATVKVFLNERRAEICPEEPSVEVTVHGPCASEVMSGIHSECVLSMAAGEETANRRVRMVEPATGGATLYFEFDSDDPDEHYCKGLFFSSFVLDESQAPDGSSLLENTAWSDSSAEISNEQTLGVGGWLGHDAELEYLQLRLLAEHGEELPPDHPAAKLQVMTEPVPSSYGQDPGNLPDSFSIISGFTSGRSGRSSSECFPGGGLEQKPGGSMVTNQGECGSCWAQAGSGVVSDRLCLAGAPGMGGNGLNRTVSVQQALSCQDFPEGVDPCVGGLAALYFDFAIEKGLAKRRDSPYTMKCPKKKGNPHSVVAPEKMGIDCDSLGPESEDAPGLSEFKCVCIKDQTSRKEKIDSCPVATQNVREVYKIESFKRMPYPGEPLGMSGRTWRIADVVSLYKSELFANGPFFVGFQTFSDFMAHFKERKVYIHNPASQHQGGHAVVLTGWGTHKQLPYPWQCKAPGHRQGRPHHGRPHHGPNRAIRPHPHRPFRPMPQWGPFPMYSFGGRNIPRKSFQPPGPAHMGPVHVGPGHMRPPRRPLPPGPRRGPGRMEPLPDMPSKVPNAANYVKNCNKEITLDYWELRNSWGTDWGDNGYFYMRSGYNEVGLESSGRVPQVDVKTAGPFDANLASTHRKPTVPVRECSGKGTGCQTRHKFYSIGAGYQIDEFKCTVILRSMWCP